MWKHLSACESLQLKCFGPVTISASTSRFTSLVPVFWNLPILVELPLINHWWYLIFLYYMSQFLSFSSNTAITSFHLLHMGLKFCQVTYKSISYGKMGQQVLASTLRRVDGFLRVCFLISILQLDNWSRYSAIYLRYFLGTALSYFRFQKSQHVFLPIGGIHHEVHGSAVPDVGRWPGFHRILA